MARGIFATPDSVWVINDEFVDENGTHHTNISDYLKLANGDLVQIFFTSGIPSDPVISPEAGRQFESYQMRVFETYTERVFLS